MFSAHSTILDNTTASFTTADETKVDYLTVTAATDLDEIRNRVIELDQAVILQGTWDPNSASPASFPQGVSSPVAAGYTWIITSDATVDGVSFHTDDKVIALVDSPDPTSADDWHVSEYHDDVISVAGLDGIISAADLRTAINVADGAEVNVNADWNSVSGDSQILNKPTLGTAALQQIQVILQHLRKELLPIVRYYSPVILH